MEETQCGMCGARRGGSGGEEEGAGVLKAGVSGTLPSFSETLRGNLGWMFLRDCLSAVGIYKLGGGGERFMSLSSCMSGFAVCARSTRGFHRRCSRGLSGMREPFQLKMFFPGRPAQKGTAGANQLRTVRVHGSIKRHLFCRSFVSAFNCDFFSFTVLREILKTPLGCLSFVKNLPLFLPKGPKAFLRVIGPFGTVYVAKHLQLFGAGCLQ